MKDDFIINIYINLLPVWQARVSLAESTPIIFSNPELHPSPPS